MSTETTNKKIKIDNGTTFGRTYTDKAVDERLQGLVSTATFTPVKEKANNSLQKPAGLTKTKLVGVGANGQENIEIGDNLTLANGKLSATGGGSGGGEYDIVTLSEGKYTGTITGTKPLIIIDTNGDYLLPSETFELSANSATCNVQLGYSTRSIHFNKGMYAEMFIPIFYNHFITITNVTDNVALYLTIKNVNDREYSIYSLASYLAGKKVLVNGNLHGVVPTYISGENNDIKIYYRTPGDSNINPDPDVYDDLSSFTITDLVTPLE